MSIKNCFRSVAILAIVAAAQIASAAVFVQPTLSGTTPSGLTWQYVSSGSALPVQTTGTSPSFNKPGAVAYWDVSTGQLQIDPKGWNISLFNFTYTTGTVNTSGSTAGPLVYASGTSPTTATVSDATGLAGQRTLPAGTWTLITCAPARIAGTVSLVRVPTLATTYDPGNGAGSGSTPYSTQPNGLANTAGWFTQPWAFPAGMVASGSAATMSVEYWRTFGVTGNANANVLGYGNYQSTFQYTLEGTTGNQVGAVIPVFSVPEPGTMILAGVGIAAAAGLDFRRRQRKQAPALTNEG